MVYLDQFAEAVCGDPVVRVIVFDSADPDFFVAHGDMAILDDPAGFAALPIALTQRPSWNPMMRLHERIRTLPQLTIAKLRGLARGGGGGSELLTAMDMRFASLEKAGLAQMEVSTGIIPGAGGTAYLPRLVGRARALENHPRRSPDRCGHRGTLRMDQPRHPRCRPRRLRRLPRRSHRQSATRSHPGHESGGRRGRRLAHTWPGRRERMAHEAVHRTGGRPAHPRRRGRRSADPGRRTRPGSGSPIAQITTSCRCRPTGPPTGLPCSARGS